MNVCVFGYKKKDELACCGDCCDETSLNGVLNEPVDQSTGGIVCALSFNPSQLQSIIGDRDADEKQAEQYTYQNDHRDCDDYIAHAAATEPNLAIVLYCASYNAQIYLPQLQDQES